MSTELTPVDTYHTTTTAPADGDPANGATFQAGLQDLADNALYLKNIVDGLHLHGAQFDIAGSSIATDGLFTVVGTAPTVGYLTYIEGATNQIEVPESGLYEITLSGDFRNSSDATAGATTQVAIRKNGVTVNQGVFTNYRVLATTGSAVGISGTVLVEITTPASERITVANPMADLGGVAVDARLTIKRIAALP